MNWNRARPDAPIELWYDFRADALFLHFGGDFWNPMWTEMRRFPDSAVLIDPEFCEYQDIERPA
jgi:hypothetical protein